MRDVRLRAVRGYIHNVTAIFTIAAQKSVSSCRSKNRKGSKQAAAKLSRLHAENYHLPKRIKTGRGRKKEKWAAARQESSGSSVVVTTVDAYVTSLSPTSPNLPHCPPYASPRYTFFLPLSLFLFLFTSLYPP
jgi:hypothetical protein